MYTLFCLWNIECFDLEKVAGSLVWNEKKSTNNIFSSRELYYKYYYRCCWKWMDSGGHQPLQIQYAKEIMPALEL